MVKFEAREVADFLKFRLLKYPFVRSITIFATGKGKARVEAHNRFLALIL